MMRKPDKPRGGRVVPSRFQQSAAAAASKSRLAVTPAKQQPNETEKDDRSISVDSISSLTSFRVGMASTPFHHSSVNNKPGSLANSSVGSDMLVSNIQQELVSHDDSSGACNASTEQGSKKSSHKTKIKNLVEYAKYLQAAFLDAKAQAMAKQLRETAKGKIAIYNDYRFQLAKREEALDLEIAETTHVLDVSKEIKKQESVLNKTLDVANEMNTKCSEIASALDSTQYRLQVKGVHMGDDPQKYKESLESSLNKLAALSHNAEEESKFVAEVKEMAENATELKNVLSEEVNEIKRCNTDFKEMTQEFINDTAAKLMSSQLIEQKDPVFSE